MPTLTIRTPGFLPLLFCLIVTGIGLASTAHGAARAADQAFDAARAAVENAKLDDSARQAALAQLDAARTDLREADALTRQAEELRAGAAGQPARMEQLRNSLALDRDQAIEEWAKRLPADADAETLERVLEQERRLIAGLQAQIEAVGGELALTLSRPAQAAGDIANLRLRIDTLSTPPTAQDQEPAALVEVRRLRHDSALKRAQAELELRLLEQDTATQRQRLHELTIRELRYRLGLHVRRTEHLQERIANLGRREMESLLTRIQARNAELAGESFISAAAADNLTLSIELIQNNELLVGDRSALAAIEQARERTEASLRDSRARLEFGGTNERVGRWWWSERRQLEPPARLKQRQQQIRGTLADLRVRDITLNEQSRDLTDIGAAARALADAVNQGSDDDAGEAPASATLEPLLRERVELIELLKPLLERRIAALEQTERALEIQISSSRALEQLLDRHLLWIPSHAPIQMAWLERLPEGVSDLVKPSRFMTTLKLSWSAIRDQPLPWFGSLLLIVMAIELRRRAPERIEAQAATTRQIRRDTYRATARALGWTLVAALPAPLALALLGDLLQNVGNSGKFSDSLGRTCTALVLPLFTLQLLRWSAIERGLGHAHFRWVKGRREVLRRALPRAAAVVLPMYFIATLAFNRNLDLPNDVQARIGIVVACLALAWTLWYTLDAGRVLATRGAVDPATPWHTLLRIALPLVPLATAALALAGYVYSAGMLLHALLSTFSLTVVVALVVGLLARWFLLGERRLAMHRQEELRAAAAPGDERAAAAAEAEPDVTLEQVNAQTGRLMRALRITLFGGGLIWVWGEVLPAFARADEIALWHFTETGADGASVTLPVTLAAVLLGLFALTMTTIGARNLPGLVEIGLLSKTRIDAATRYAITSVLRYAIVIIGALIGLNLLGLRWGQLQWMAAALTVGLGFGLQEIFANFVSGLILLFERPFRIGDVVTVGELSGRVTRIRTRATTIVDFDNKEIVVPNKNFITGQLINWTLSDTTTRVTINVGVAYGTDPALVHKLLLTAARSHPLVLAEPESKSWFLRFGASSLDFELRVFVGSISERLEVQNGLNTHIAALFAEHGVEIAFPQLDLHVRDAPRVMWNGDAPPASAG
jgi:potassium-dependent mechanosensitive channel